MIGDEYLQTRAQLGTVLFSLSTLAHELNAEPGVIETLQGLGSSLREPFLFVVVGEVKAGKSSLLNALFGREFCKVDVLPATDKIYVFKYGAREHNVNITDRLTECYRPAVFLRDFNIVDTPGTNTIVAEHQTITEQFVPMADLVLFVFSVTNPWAASAWDFLKFVNKKWLKNVVFVLQQCDLRNDIEVAAIVQHLEETVRERLGGSHPVFAISAKKAFLAKTTAPDKAGLMAESNLDKLENYINQSVARGEARIGKLQAVCQTAQVIMGDFMDHAQAAYSVARRDSEKLEHLNLSLDERKKQTQQQLSGMLWTLSQCYERAQRRGEELLKQNLSLLQTFKFIFRKADWQTDFDEKIETQLQDSLRQQVQNAVELLELDLKNLWYQLHEALQKQFPTEMQAPHIAPDFSKERDQLLRRIELTLVQNMSEREIQQQMAKLFEQASNSLRVPAGAAVAAGGIATIVAALAHTAILDVTGTVAAVAALVGTTVALVRRGRLISQFRAQIAQRREEMLMAIESHLRHAIEVFYQELTATFQPLHNFCAAQTKLYEPRMERIRQLQETLGKCAADLGIVQHR